MENGRVPMAEHVEEEEVRNDNIGAESGLQGESTVEKGFDLQKESGLQKASAFQGKSGFQGELELQDKCESEKNTVLQDISELQDKSESQENTTPQKAPQLQSEDDLRAEVEALRQEVAVLNGKLRQIERMLGLRERRPAAASGSPVSSGAPVSSVPSGSPVLPRPSGSPVPPIPSGPSIIPEMRRQRTQKRDGGGIRRINERDVGKYGAAFLAAVCILAGVGVILAAAWALSDAVIQAALLFVLGVLLAAGGWFGICRGSRSAVPPTLAACGLGILYMTCVSMYFVWHFIPVEGVLLCILIWTGTVFYMAHAGRTLVFYYVLNLGSLATACLSAVHTESPLQIWAGIFFTTAVYGGALFQVHRLHVRALSDRVPSVRRLKNVTAANALAAYAVLFFHWHVRPSVLLYALLLGGILLFCWHFWFQGSAGMETAGIVILEVQMMVYAARLAHELDGMRAAAVSFAVLLLFLLPLLRTKRRVLLSAWILWPVLWQAGLMSDFMTGTVYWIPYLVLTIYYIVMLRRPAACRICAFVPAYIGMYLILCAETRHLAGGLSFILMILYALGIPVKYMVTLLGASDDRQETENGRPLYDNRNYYGVAMLAAFVVCVTYCSEIARPVALLLELVMLLSFFGMTVWMEVRTHRYFRVLRIGMLLLWGLSRFMVGWCTQEGFLLELSAGLICLLTGSLAVVCGIHGALRSREDGVEAIYEMVSLALLSLGLYRLLLVFSLPYAILVSLILLLFAVGLLLLGFRLNSRQVRTYALFLMALCVVKMVTADLSGVDLGWRATALAGGGVLCLLVSTVYSRRERKTQQTDETEDGL